MSCSNLVTLPRDSFPSGYHHDRSLRCFIDLRLDATWTTGRMEHAGRSNTWCRDVLGSILNWRWRPPVIISAKKINRWHVRCVPKESQSVVTRQQICIKYHHVSSSQYPKKFPSQNFHVVPLHSAITARFLPLYEFTTQLQTKTAEKLGRTCLGPARHGGVTSGGLTNGFFTNGFKQQTWRWKRDWLWFFMGMFLGEYRNTYRVGIAQEWQDTLNHPKYLQFDEGEHNDDNHF